MYMLLSVVTSSAVGANQGFLYSCVGPGTTGANPEFLCRELVLLEWGKGGGGTGGVLMYMLLSVGSS